MAKSGKSVTKKMKASVKAARTVTPTKTAEQRTAVLHKVSGSVHARSAVTGRYVKVSTARRNSKKSSEQ